MTSASDDQEVPLTEEQLAARRSNRRTLIAIFLVIMVLGLIPLATVLIAKFS